MLGVSCGLGSAAPSMTLGLLAASCVVKQRNCAVTWTHFFFSFPRISRVCPLSSGHVNIVSQRVETIWYARNCSIFLSLSYSFFVVYLHVLHHTCMYLMPECIFAKDSPCLLNSGLFLGFLHFKVNNNSVYFLNACLVAYYIFMSLFMLYWKDTHVFFFCLLSLFSPNVITSKLLSFSASSNPLFPFQSSDILFPLKCILLCKNLDYVFTHLGQNIFSF